MPDNASLAAIAVANGPRSSAPPSFDGHGWLVVANLAEMTAVAGIALLLVIKLVGDLRRERGPTSRGPLVTLARVLVLVAAAGMMIRTGVEAASLWGWNPADPERTAVYQLVKRLLDPLGAGLYAAFICLFIMAEDNLLASLERQPFPERLLTTLPKLRRPAAISGLALIAAIAVVTLR